MQLKLVKGSLPTSLNKGEIEKSVSAFYREGCAGDGLVDESGFVKQTLESIAHATFLKGQGDFWILEATDGSLGGYLLARFTKDIDDQMTYWIGQTYMAPWIRHTKFVKESWEKVREHAKKHFCRHIVAVSGRRNDEAYCRFLGPGWHKYATLLKEDII